MDCPCGSGMDYSVCCGVTHRGLMAPTPLALMRARYSAYAMGNVNFIMCTTHPLNPQYNRREKVWRASLKRWCEETQFKGLEIVETQEGQSPNEGYVTFRAFLCMKNTPYTMYEKSYFVKTPASWLYRDGTQL